MPRSAAVIDGSSCGMAVAAFATSSRTAALSRTRSSAITATMITLPGLPRARRRSQNALTSGSQRMAVRAGLKRTTFTAQRREQGHAVGPSVHSCRRAMPSHRAMQFPGGRACRSRQSASSAGAVACAHPFALAHHLLLEGELQVVGLMARELSLNGDQLGLKLHDHTLDRGAHRLNRGGLRADICSACSAALSWRSRAISALSV